MDRQLKKEKCGGCEDFDAAHSGADSSAGRHPDHSPSKARVNRVQGQLNAVSRMIDEREYCPKIIQQVRAAKNALGALEGELMRRHLRGCVKVAFESRDTFEVNEKIEEIMKIIGA